MNFETTSVLLEALKPYIENSVVDISTDNKDWRNQNYKSDLVTIDAENNIGFEVFDNEIIAFYFTNHYHFEDYTSELQNGQDNYIERAKSFLKELFENKIRHVEHYKGQSLSSEKYFIMYQDGQEDECISSTWFGLSKFINPFGKKSIHSTIWQFDKSKGVFTSRPPKNTDPNAIEVIDISEDCYIEIFENHNVYTYVIMEMAFDDYMGKYYYYWTPAINTVSSGFYDTKDKAISSALEALKCRENPC
ncbi:MAG: hypothetical protein J1E81_02920 [Eubacterium sp.]|nr:hypothetical protein [Eubacterium sp.]